MSRLPSTTLSGVTLHYKMEGPAAGEPLVFIHALGCDLHLWDNVAASFATTQRTVRYDLRGHGLSGCGPAESSLDDHAQDLIDLLDRLHLASATLIGISVGGLVALATARRFPARVRRLVLCCTAARIGSAEGWSERIAAVQTKGLETMADSILARWFAPGFAEREPVLLRRWRRQLIATPAAGYTAVCAALRDADLRPELARITAPALVVSGEHDIAAPPAAGRELAAGLPQARFELIPGAAHLPPLEQPALLTAVLRQFLHESP